MRIDLLKDYQNETFDITVKYILRYNRDILISNMSMFKEYYDVVFKSGNDTAIERDDGIIICTSYMAYLKKLLEINEIDYNNISQTNITDTKHGLEHDCCNTIIGKSIVSVNENMLFDPFKIRDNEANKDVINIIFSEELISNMSIKTRPLSIMRIIFDNWPEYAVRYDSIMFDFNTKPKKLRIQLDNLDQNIVPLSLFHNDGVFIVNKHEEK